VSAKDFGIGLAVTSLMLFVASGIAGRFMPPAPALAVGAAVWALCAIGFIRAGR
jgi:hypothetical protein